MTTGEKLSKLRKENGYTQEALADILGVSRQAISKWESDGAFPETEKLIYLSGLYKCSIDYLLKDDVDNYDKGHNIFKYKKNLMTCIFSVGIFVISLLFYLFPYIGIYEYIDNSPAYVKYNVYDLINNIYINLNYILLTIPLFLQVFMVIFGICILVKDNKKFYSIRNILSMLEAITWVINMIIFCSNFQIGMIFMLILSICNLLGLFYIKFNKKN